VEVLTLIYVAITTVMTIVWWSGINHPIDMILWRVGVVTFVVLANFIYHFRPCRATMLLRVVPMLLCLIQWYPETYEFCKQFDYQDHVFAAIDWQLFGCQPSIEFSRAMPSVFWSEAFHMGYYAYFYMMIAVITFYFFARYQDFQRATFVFLASFFIYYFIYEFLPVAGPQYYYCALGEDAASQPEFPALGNYFRDHTEMLNIDIKGFFSKMVVMAHEAGERPTAAFPSSHVGMSTVCMMLAWQTRNRWLFWVLFPLWVLLVLATVYVKAHYVIDSIAGLLTAVLFFYFTQWLYPKAKNVLRLKN
jgi:membrane-associated phospholipid phosphatase